MHTFYESGKTFADGAQTTGFRNFFPTQLNVLRTGITKMHSFEAYTGACFHLRFIHREVTGWSHVGALLGVEDNFEISQQIGSFSFD